MNINDHVKISFERPLAGSGCNYYHYLIISFLLLSFAPLQVDKKPRENSSVRNKT